MPHSYFEVPQPTVIGHRGAAADAPENTLPSFEHALAVGAHILESDVQGTRDAVPVLSHDASLERMTGSPQRIEALELETLRSFDAAFGFAGDDGSYPLRGRGIGVPTLGEAFEAFPAARFNLEIKADLPGLVESVVALIAEHDRADRTLLAAESDAVMARIRAETRRAGVHPAIGASLADVVGFVQAAVAGVAPTSEAMALQIPPEFAGRPLITPQLVSHAHAHGTVVHAWTINQVSEMARLIELGVDGLITDDPARMHAHFYPE
ncbi:MAG: glycerophosphodiester phosphodiesterase [Myxococcota bacterium]|nr:glycerophosphodiester phosphodiesterase [Myxococcota bacterium]